MRNSWFGVLQIWNYLIPFDNLTNASKFNFLKFFVFNISKQNNHKLNFNNIILKYVIFVNII